MGFAQTAPRSQKCVCKFTQSDDPAVLYCTVSFSVSDVVHVSRMNADRCAEQAQRTEIISQHTGAQPAN